tara:strand:+ start:429 stop:773 length:345 start_codon:yes stop_codon:yes gene_type:complete
MTFIIWFFTTYGIVNGVINSTLIQPTVYKLLASQNKAINYIGQLLWCPMCLGFWLGGLLGYFWISPTGYFLFGCLPLADAFIASGLCWVVHCIASAAYSAAYSKKKSKQSCCGQ